MNGTEKKYTNREKLKVSPVRRCLIPARESWCTHQTGMRTACARGIRGAPTKPECAQRVREESVKAHRVREEET